MARSYHSNQDNFAGGRPAASHFLLLCQNKVTKEKATPVCRPCGVPCVARLVRRLRNSHDPLRVHVLKQCSPTSPDQSALLGGAQGKKSEKPKPKIRVGNELPDTFWIAGWAQCAHSGRMQSAKCSFQVGYHKARWATV
jgi:hypothetical protein